MSADARQGGIEYEKRVGVNLRDGGILFRQGFSRVLGRIYLVAVAEQDRHQIERVLHIINDQDAFHRRCSRDRFTSPAKLATSFVSSRINCSKRANCAS